MEEKERNQEERLFNAILDSWERANEQRKASNKVYYILEEMKINFGEWGNDWLIDIIDYANGKKPTKDEFKKWLKENREFVLEEKNDLSLL